MHESRFCTRSSKMPSAPASPQAAYTPDQVAVRRTHKISGDRLASVLYRTVAKNIITRSPATAEKPRDDPRRM